MEKLLPSETARVVLGYLQEEKCPKIADRFLEESKYLTECLEEARAGEEVSTRPYGKSLKDMLKEYCELLKIVNQNVKKLPTTEKNLVSKKDIVEQLGHLLEKVPDNPLDPFLENSLKGCKKEE